MAMAKRTILLQWWCCSVSKYFCLYFVKFYLILFRFRFLYMSLIVMLFDFPTADILEAWRINNSDKDIKVADISYFTSFLLFFFPLCFVLFSLPFAVYT